MKIEGKLEEIINFYLSIYTALHGGVPKVIVTLDENGQIVADVELKEPKINNV